MTRFRPLLIGTCLAGFAMAPQAHASIFDNILNRDEKRVLNAEQLTTQESAADTMLKKAKNYESGGKHRQARDTYKSVSRSYPRTDAGAEAKFGYGRMLEAEGEGRKAFEEYQELISNYPNFPGFSEVIQRQFAIADKLRQSDRKGFLGIGAAIQPSKLIEMFESISEAAPHTEFAPRSILNIGYVNSEQGEQDKAIASFQSVVDTYAGTKYATEAQYEIFKLRGMKAENSNSPNQDRAQVEAGLDFVNQNPNDQRSSEIKSNLHDIEERSMKKMYDTGMFYEKSGKPVSARLYYREVVKNPNTPWASKAQERLNALDASENSVESRAGLFGPNPLKRDKVEMRDSNDDVVPLPSTEGA